MPRLTSTTSAPKAIPANGYYPKLLQGDSGSIWLVTAPRTGVIVNLARTPQKSKHTLGYQSTKLVEEKMRVYNAPVTLQFAA